MKKSFKNLPKVIRTNLSEIETKDKNSLSKTIGTWLAIQSKEMLMKK
jgi:hypothetical protein